MFLSLWFCRFLIFTSGCFCVLEAVFVFCFGSCARRCFVSCEVYCDCQSVLALREQPFTEVQDAVMLIALWCSSGFPLRRGEVLQVHGFVTHVLVSSLVGSERSVSLLPLQLEWTPTSTQAGLRRSSSSRSATSACTKQRPRCLGRQREMMAASPRLSFFSRSAPGGVVGVRFTILFRLYAIFASLLLVLWSK